MKRLIESDFSLERENQSADGSYYSLKLSDRVVDFGAMEDTEILRRVRAFGIVSQGVVGDTLEGPIRIFDVEPITNPFLLETYAAYLPEAIILKYENRLLVKTREGIVKVKSFEPCGADDGYIR